MEGRHSIMCMREASMSGISFSRNACTVKGSILQRETALVWFSLVSILPSI
ncbi:MAG: hypothetical protein FWF68_04750 [Spirochaetes bacterium]|nr:hypothetical protein [Spirochaetota bacterium]